jgi:RNA polymerase sigma-70 factor (ECF subfamily)
VRARDPQAWRQLADLYGPLVYGWCRNRGLQSADADDVLQEVFLTVASRIADFRRDREGDTFRGWLAGITRNKIGDWLRHRHKGETATGGTDAHQLLLEAPAVEPASWPAPGEPGDLYRRALEVIRTEFTERTWQAFWKVVVEDRLPADVAADLGMSRNAVYLARSHVLRRLREMLGEDENAPPVSS